MTNKDNDKPLYLALYNLIKYLYLIIKNYPKEYKYTLGEDTLRLAWSSLDYIIEANHMPNSDKQKYINKAIIIFNRLKYRLRLASELKIINHNSYAYFIKQSAEINKMLNGWLTWSKGI